MDLRGTCRRSYLSGHKGRWRRPIHPRSTTTCKGDGRLCPKTDRSVNNTFGMKLNRQKLIPSALIISPHLVVGAFLCFTQGGRAIIGALLNPTFYTESPPDWMLPWGCFLLACSIHAGLAFSAIKKNSNPDAILSMLVMILGYGMTYVLFLLSAALPLVFSTG